MNRTISSDESTDEEEVFRDVDEEAKLIIQTETLPKKSADRYKLVHENYKKWQIEHGSSLSSSEEANLIVYFKDLTKKLKPSTLWSIWSMLKKTLNTNDNIDMNRFQNLKSLIGNNSKGYKPKKSSVLKWEEIMRFVNDASDYTHLGSKVILILGICGALRCDELTRLMVQDLEDLGNKYLISINDTKNEIPRQFIVGGLFYGKVKEYTSMRPKETFTARFLIQYHRGKCAQQVIGRNKIEETPHLIAAHLNLPNAKSYTGHCFRRTGANLLSNSGANTTMLKQLGGWKSTGIAQGYVENSLRNRENIFESIIQASRSVQVHPQPSTSTAGETITNNQEESTNVAHDSTNFSNEFEISQEDLVKIDKLNRVEVSSTPIPSFKTANNKKILVDHNRQPTLPTHFLKKSPIKIFPEQSQNKPVETESYINQRNQIPKLKPINRTGHENPTIAYQNCVFGGNIINNFHHSCDHDEK